MSICLNSKSRSTCGDKKWKHQRSLMAVIKQKHHSLGGVKGQTEHRSRVKGVLGEIIQSPKWSQIRSKWHLCTIVSKGSTANLINQPKIVYSEISKYLSLRFEHMLLSSLLQTCANHLGVWEQTPERKYHILQKKKNINEFIYNKRQKPTLRESTIAISRKMFFFTVIISIKFQDVTQKSTIKKPIWFVNYILSLLKSYNSFVWGTHKNLFSYCVPQEEKRGKWGGGN